MVVEGRSRQCILNKAWVLPRNWETVRQRLLQRRICDLGLRIKGSSLEPSIEQLERELLAKGVDFVPSFYLTDTWGCPDKVPVVGIPFLLVLHPAGAH